MDLLDRIELIVRFFLLGATMFWVDDRGNYFQKQIKRINSIVYNHGNESVRSSESGSCSVAEGAFRDIRDDESEGSSGTGEGDEGSESGEPSEEESDGSEYQPSGVSDDSFWTSNVVYQRGS